MLWIRPPNSADPILNNINPDQTGLKEVVFEFKHNFIALTYKCTSKRVGPQVLPTLVTALPEKFLIPGSSLIWVCPVCPELSVGS